MWKWCRLFRAFSHAMNAAQYSVYSKPICMMVLYMHICIQAVCRCFFSGWFLLLITTLKRVFKSTHSFWSSIQVQNSYHLHTQRHTHKSQLNRVESEKIEATNQCYKCVCPMWTCHIFLLFGGCFSGSLFGIDPFVKRVVHTQNKTSTANRFMVRAHIIFILTWIYGSQLTEKQR